MLFGQLRRHFELKGLLKQASDHTNLTIGGVYAGFDPTAESLHIGNLVPIVGLVHSASIGLRPWALVGSATALVGDPTGRSSEKPALDVAQIEKNSSLISNQIQKIYNNSRENFIQLPEMKIVNNAEWFGTMSFMQFLTEVGRKVRVNAMLSKNCVQSRLNCEDGLTFCEMTYQLMQGYDFYHLNRSHGVNVQIGGSDQWGNMLTGLELAEKLTGRTVACLTMPLLTNAKGEKMGKSSGNGVWLDPSMTCVYDFYQYFASLSDEDVMKLLPLLVLEEKESIDATIAEHLKRPEQHLAQKHLAHSITKLIHGTELTTAAEQLSQALFKQGFDPSRLSNIDQILSSDRLRTIYAAETNSELTALTFLQKVFPEHSKGHLRRTIQSGAFMINYIKITDPSHSLSVSQFGRILLVNMGKTSFYIVKVMA